MTRFDKTMKILRAAKLMEGTDPSGYRLVPISRWNAILELIEASANISSSIDGAGAGFVGDAVGDDEFSDLWQAQHKALQAIMDDVLGDLDG